MREIRVATGAAIWTIRIQTSRIAGCGGAKISGQIFQPQLLCHTAFLDHFTVWRVIAGRRNALQVVFVKTTGSVGLCRRVLLAPEADRVGRDESRAGGTNRTIAGRVTHDEIAGRITHQLILLEVAKPARRAGVIRTEHAQVNLVEIGSFSIDADRQARGRKDTVDRLNFVQDILQGCRQFTRISGLEVLAAAILGHRRQQRWVICCACQIICNADGVGDDVLCAIGKDVSAVLLEHQSSPFVSPVLRPITGLRARCNSGRSTLGRIESHGFRDLQLLSSGCSHLHRR